MKAYPDPEGPGIKFGPCDVFQCAWLGDNGECAIKNLSEIADNWPR